MAVPVAKSKVKTSQDIVASSKLTSEQQIAKTRDDFLKIIVASLKYQNPDKPADTNQIAQTMATIQQSEEIVKMRAGMDKLGEALLDNKLGKALPLQGRHVRLDTSTRQLQDGGGAEFVYQLKYDTSKQPAHSTISTILSVYDSNNLKVFETKGNSKKGVHSYKWDGKDATGQKLPPGSYSLRVSSYFQNFDQEGKLIKMPIDAGPFIEGEVESIDIKDGEVRLYVDGKPYSMEDIIHVDPAAKQEETLLVSDYASYIGKTVDLEDNKLSIGANGKATLNYKCDIDRPGKLLIHMIDDSGLLQGVAIVDNVAKGANKLVFTASSALTESDAEKFLAKKEEFPLLKPGNYKIKIFQQNQLDIDPAKYNEVSLKRSVKVTGLDFSREPLIVAGLEKFPVSSITTLSELGDHETALSDGAKFIGKLAKVKLSKFEVKPGQKFEKQFIIIPKPDATSRLGGALMKVYDNENRLVAEVATKTLIEAKGDNILYTENLWDLLTDADQAIILGNRALDTARMGGKSFKNIQAHYHNVVNPLRGRDVFPDFVREIVDGYTAKTLKLDEQKLAEYLGIRDFASLPEESKELVRDATAQNKPVTGFYWDLKDKTGKKVPPGTYRYEFQLEKYHKSPSGGAEILEVETIDDFAAVKIAEYRTDKGEIEYYGYAVDGDGNALGDRNQMIRFSMEEIVSIQST